MSPVLRRAAWFVPLAMAAYVLRFGSCWLVLVNSPVERRFDPHGFGLLGDLVLLTALLPVLAGLLWWVLRRNRTWRGILAPASTWGWTAVSVLLLLLLGAPTPNQVAALALLPLRDAGPVALSALLWFAVVAGARALAVGAPPLAVGAQQGTPQAPRSSVAATTRPRRS